jgi:nicotinate-nucleotide adenylyltransferase
LSERLGVFGGTFDPIHLGHLRAAEAARETARLDRVLFVPAGRPPHRDATSASPLDRYAMVSLATAAHPAFAPSDVELRREGPSYTLDTLLELRRQWPEAEPFLILGSDAFAEIGTWREPRRVAELCTLVVIERPGADAPAAEPIPGARVVRVPAVALPISSSAVRRLRGEGRSVRYLVPDPVADHIQKRELYR